MRLIANSGTDRVIDVLRDSISAESKLDIASPAFSLFAYGEIKDLFNKIKTTRLLLPDVTTNDLGLFGSNSERPYRNRLQARWLAKNCAQMGKQKCGRKRGQNHASPIYTCREGRQTRTASCSSWKLPNNDRRAWSHARAME